MPGSKTIIRVQLRPFGNCLRSGEIFAEITIISTLLQEHARCDRKGWDCVERNFDNNFTCSVSCEGIYADIQLALLGGEEKKADEGKVTKLIDQYENFKRRTLPNFRFNPQKGTTHYGKKGFTKDCIHFFLQNVDT